MLYIVHTVFPHIVAAATILCWNCKTLKNWYSFRVVVFLLCNENLNSFLTRVRKLFKGGNYMRKLGTRIDLFQSMYNDNTKGTYKARLILITLFSIITLKIFRLDKSKWKIAWLKVILMTPWCIIFPNVHDSMICNMNEIILM